MSAQPGNDEAKRESRSGGSQAGSQSGLAGGAPVSSQNANNQNGSVVASSVSGGGVTAGANGAAGSSTANANNRRPRQAISYAAERVIGNGSFGVVYQATVLETQETVAIKKVLQDRRFRNRELQIMSSFHHPNIVTLKHCFYSKGERPDDLYLNLVMEYVPETIYRTLRNHTKAKKLVPILHTKCYMYQICRSLAHLHATNVCHRDIKPQNLLLNARTHEVKLCDFGSAKQLVRGEPNVSYICSRYYRAPELVFEATEYTTSVDIWSLGCVMAELLLGTPLFPGDSGLEQLIEIIKILGTPTREEIYAMNPHHTRFRFPSIQPHTWARVFRNRAPPAAVDLVSQFLRYIPSSRLHPFDALAHPFFDELREPGVRLPNGRPPPNVHNWLDSELQMMDQRGLRQRLIPPFVARQMVDGKLPHTLMLDNDESIVLFPTPTPMPANGLGPENLAPVTQPAPSPPLSSHSSSSSSSSGASMGATMGPSVPMPVPMPQPMPSSMSSASASSSNLPASSSSLSSAPPQPLQQQYAYPSQQQQQQQMGAVGTNNNNNNNNNGYYGQSGPVVSATNITSMAPPPVFQGASASALPQQFQQQQQQQQQQQVYSSGSSQMGMSMGMSMGMK